MIDKDIDTSDMPELDDEFFRNAELRMPPKQSVTLYLDTNIVTWFKENGKDVETHIDRILRHYMDSQVAHQQKWFVK